MGEVTKILKKRQACGDIFLQNPVAEAHGCPTLGRLQGFALAWPHKNGSVKITQNVEGWGKIAVF